MGKQRRERQRNTKWLQLIGLGLVVALTVTLTAISLREQPAPVAEASVDTHAPAADPLVFPTVVFIGDSFIGGSDQGGAGFNNWTSLASQELDWRACNFAVGGSGWSVGQNQWTYAARVPWAVSVKPSAIVFANGVGDLATNAATAPDDAAAALAAIQVEAPDTTVIVVGIAKVRDEQSPVVDRFNQRMRTVVETGGGIFIDPTADGWFDGENRSLLGADLFHPTDAGHEHYAREFISGVRAAGVEIPMVLNSQTDYCSAPQWGQLYPDGSVIPPAAPTAAPSN
jgi:lysophospholipase L1-like esterase